MNRSLKQVAGVWGAIVESACSIFCSKRRSLGAEAFFCGTKVFHPVVFRFVVVGGGASFGRGARFESYAASLR